MNIRPRARFATFPTAIYISLLTLVGFILRLYQLGARGYWFDEIVFAYPARLPTLDALLSHVQEWSDHTPLSFFLVWFVRGLGGDEAVVRLPFAIAGALGIPALYFLGKSLFNARVGLIAALLYALSPFAVFVSQDAHPYAPLMLFTALQTVFAYRAATTGRPLDWAGFGLFTLLNLYNDYLALGVAAVTVSFLALVLLTRFAIAIRKPSPLPADKPANEIRKLIVQPIAFASTLAAVFILYLPWLKPTLVFLKMPVRTFYSTRTGGATFDDVRTLAGGLGFNALLAFLLLAGLLYTILALRRGKAIQGLLLLIWIGAPLAGLWLLAGDRLFLLQTRYFSFLLPPVLVLVGLGTDQLANLAATAYKRFYLQRNKGAILPPYVSNIALVALIVLILALAIPGLITSYSWSKPAPQSFREAARMIIADSPPGSVALSVGMWGDKPAPPFTIQGVEHYLWLYKSSIPYIDASLIDQHTAAQFANIDAIVWGIWALPTPMPPESIQAANDMGLEVIPLENLTLLRSRAPRGSNAQQLEVLLSWGTQLQSGLIATRTLLDPAYKASILGDNILPPISPANVEDPQAGPNQQDKWRLPANASIPPYSPSFLLNATNPKEQTNITLSTNKLIPGQKYVVTFNYSNDQLRGDQRVYLSTYTKEGQLIETFPYGSGFLCPSGPPSGSAFLFTMPQNGTNALLWLRIEGEGQAAFANIAIQPIR